MKDLGTADLRHAFLAGGGEMGALIRAHDWDRSVLGPPSGWPQALKTAVRLMLNTGHPMYIFWGPSGACLYNDAYRLSIGPERHPGSLGRPAREVWAEIWDAIGPQIEQVMSGGAATWHENQFLPITRNGQLEDVYWTYSYGPIDDETAANGVGGVLVVCTETTEQVLSARRAAEGMRAFAELFDQAPTFMAMLRGPEHRFERANPGYQRLIGEREVLGRAVAEVFPEVIGQGYIDLLDRVYATGEPYAATGAEIEIFDPEGGASRVRYLDFVYQPIKDATGVVTGIFVEGFDVTDRALADAALRDSEARLREANETLEAKVEARTGELMAAEESLRQAQKMEAVGQLTGGLAHDFNNLLAGISGSLELLQKRVAEGRFDLVERYVTAAQGAARRAASLTQRLLAFSRRQTLDPQPTDLNRVVVDIEELIRRSVGPAVEIVVVAAADLWPILVDPVQLDSALLNLCINASDAMPEGGRLTIETANLELDAVEAARHDLEPGDYVWLCVRDTGMGMTPEIIARAFDPFFTTKPIGEGTGLGLSMIYGFTRQSGGQVRIESEVGQGASICLYLPRHLGDVAGPRTAAEVAAGGGARHEETVLVIDDEPAVRMIVVEVLADAGFRVLEAADAPGGMKILRSSAQVDLLITDVGLPGGMNGRQVADAGRALRPGLKTLFITGYADNAAVGAGRLEPGMAVMVKPFSVHDLSRRVRELVSGA